MRRQEDGKQYAGQTLINIRSGLNRYLNLPPFQFNWDLSRDNEFKDANKIIRGLRRRLKEDGQDKRKRRQPISQKHLMQISNVYFSAYEQKGPKCLQHKVFMDLGYLLGRRGCEGLRTLTKDSFEIKKDLNGTEYLQLAYHERTKKCQGEEYDPYREEMIIAQQPNSALCPVKAYKFYLSKLSSKINCLFQRPNKFYQTEGQSWYLAAPVGVNAIGQFMKQISREAGLPIVYTNHCLRGTTATALLKMGCTIHDIANVTKHKNTDSLKYYLGKPSLDDMINFSMHCTCMQQILQQIECQRHQNFTQEMKG